MKIRKNQQQQQQQKQKKKKISNLKKQTERETNVELNEIIIMILITREEKRNLPFNTLHYLD